MGKGRSEETRGVGSQIIENARSRSEHEAPIRCQAVGYADARRKIRVGRTPQRTAARGWGDGGGVIYVLPSCKRCSAPPRWRRIEFPSQAIDQSQSRIDFPSVLSEETGRLKQKLCRLCIEPVDAVVRFAGGQEIGYTAHNVFQCGRWTEVQVNGAVVTAEFPSVCSVRYREIVRKIELRASISCFWSGRIKPRIERAKLEIEAARIREIGP